MKSTDLSTLGLTAGGAPAPPAPATPAVPGAAGAPVPGAALEMPGGGTPGGGTPGALQEVALTGEGPFLVSDKIGYGYLYNQCHFSESIIAMTV